MRRLGGTGVCVCVCEVRQLCSRTTWFVSITFLTLQIRFFVRTRSRFHHMSVKVKNRMKIHTESSISITIQLE